jgi:predicted transposase/invertase (TIGR01784 family)
LPKLPESSDGGKLWNWLYFIDAKTEEDLTMIAKSDEILNKAVVKLRELSKDERARMLHESREKMRRDNASREQAARDEGKHEGKLEGILENKRETAQTALRKKMSVQDIIELTGLTEEEIKALEANI